MGQCQHWSGTVLALEWDSLSIALGQSQHWSGTVSALEWDSIIIGVGQSQHLSGAVKNCSSFAGTKVVLE